MMVRNIWLIDITFRLCALHLHSILPKQTFFYPTKSSYGICNIFWSRSNADFLSLFKWTPGRQMFTGISNNGKINHILNIICVASISLRIPVMLIYVNLARHQFSHDGDCRWLESWLKKLVKQCLWNGVSQIVLLQISSIKSRFWFWVVNF